MIDNNKALIFSRLFGGLDKIGGLVEIRGFVLRKRMLNLGNWGGVGEVSGQWTMDIRGWCGRTPI